MKSLFLAEHDAYLRYHDFPGDGPPILMLHGLGSASSLDYPHIARHQFFCGRHLILPDFLGFGYSDRPKSFDYSLESHAETIFALIRKLDLPRCDLFGHSMGGAIAIALTAAHSECVGRLCLAEANLDPGVGQISRQIADQPEAGFVSSGYFELVKNIRNQSAHDPGLSAWVGALAIADSLAIHRSAVGLIRGTTPSQRELFLSMKIPRSFMFGQRSLPDPDVDILGSSGIRVVTVDGAGHAMMHDNPEGFARALREAFPL